jgi:hypothetical protein
MGEFNGGPEYNNLERFNRMEAAIQGLITLAHEHSKAFIDLLAVIKESRLEIQDLIELQKEQRIDIMALFKANKDLRESQ